MSETMVANDNNTLYSSFTGVPAGWYHKFLDENQKRPDYKMLTGLAILGKLYMQADEEGFIPGEYSLDGINTGAIHLSQEIMEDFSQYYKKGTMYTPLYTNLVNSIVRTQDELEYRASHLISYLFFSTHRFLTEAYELAKCEDLSTKETEYLLGEYKLLGRFLISKASLIGVFNETPQRIRITLDFLKKLDLVKFISTSGDRIEGIINYNKITNILKSELDEEFCDA